MNTCQHTFQLDIVEDFVTHIMHFICGNCGTDFGDAIQYIVKLHNRINQLEIENKQLKEEVKRRIQDDVAKL